jgi:Protein of unknown function (DUF2987)
MRLWLCAPLALLAFTNVQAAEAGTDKRYSDYYKQLGPAKAADPNNVLRIIMCMQPASKDDALPPDLAFEVRDGEQITPLPLDSEHCLEMPANAAWAEHNAVVHKNTSMKLHGNVNIISRLPKSTELSYGELTAGIPVFKDVIASQGTMARLFGPSAKGLVIQFASDAAQTLIVHVPGGDKTYTSDAKGLIRLPFDPALNAARVQLSAMPKQMGPDT